MDRRSFATGVLGWVVPGLLALPLALAGESAGGESALAAVLAWWGVGVVGCALAGVVVGARGRKAGSLADAFRSGLAGVAMAWFAAIAVSVIIEALVRVLHLGPVTVLLPIPFVLGYGVGFGLGAFFSGPPDSTQTGVSRGEAGGAAAGPAGSTGSDDEGATAR